MTARLRVRNGLAVGWTRLVSNQRPLACEASSVGNQGLPEESAGHLTRALKPGSPVRDRPRFSRVLDAMFGLGSVAP